MYTKGETAGGWIHVMEGKKPVALVHPKHVDKFMASSDLYEALHTLRCGGVYDSCADWLQEMIDKALAKADNK